MYTEYELKIARIPKLEYGTLFYLTTDIKTPYMKIKDGYVNLLTREIKKSENIPYMLLIVDMEYLAKRYKISIIETERWISDFQTYLNI